MFDRKLTNQGSSLNSKLTNFDNPTKKLLDVIESKTSKETFLLKQEDRQLTSRTKAEVKSGGLAIGRDAASIKGSGDGGGITSPLTESAIKPKTYHTEQLNVDTAGLICYIVNPLHEIYFMTADSVPKEIKFILQPPPAP